MTRWTASFEESLRRHHYPGQMALPAPLEQNSDPADIEPRSVVVPDRTLLEDVSAKRATMVRAREEWIAAVYAAADAGFSNTEIGGMSGMTEAGVRLLRNRNRRPRL